MAGVVMCSRCGAENAADQAFCGSCGAPLSRACALCDTPNPASFKFCGACGAALDGSAAQPLPEEGERRVTTVLFADLSGFTTASERMDPEEIAIVVDRCMGLMGGIVVRFGGMVARVIGDEMMALFGAPAAHEDDPERAVRAALELQTCARDYVEDFAGMCLRVGVNTGDSLFGPIGPEREFTVMGDAVNVAKRLQSAAPLGGVLVGEATYLAARDSIRYEALDPILAKGKSEPVGAWRALEAVAAPAARAVSAAPIVGRSGELDLLRRIWSRVEAERRPHLVTVLGPPGIGKTRITHEITTPLEALGVRVLRGRCLPYGESTGYGAFAQQLKGVAGIMETDDAPVAQRKLQEAITDLVPAEEALGVARTLPALLGLEAEEAAERGAVFQAARRFVEAVGRQRPTVLVFEDVHWADQTLLDLLESLALRSRDTPVLFLTLARPELLDRRPSWGGGLSAYTVLPLEALREGDARRLLGSLLPGIDETDARTLVETGGGNPLFIEELAASAGGGGSLADLPRSVTGLIAARLDTLPSRERRVLMDASVVGKVFWRGALESMSGRSLAEVLDELEAKDLIRRESSSRISGDVQYLFKHMLIREVAYQTFPRAARRNRHREVAEFIERSAGDRITESASLLAHHWKEGGDSARAIDYLLKAAEHAAGAWAKGEAIDLYGDAFDLIPASDAPRRRSVLLHRAMQRVAVGEFAAAAADIDSILDALDGIERIEALIARARASFWLFRGEEGVAFAQRAVEEAESLAAEDLVAPALAILSHNLAAEPDWVREAVVTGERARALWKPGVQEDFRANHSTILGLACYWLGDAAKALEHCRRGYEMSVELHAYEGVVSGGANYGLALAGLGHHEEAITLLEKVLIQAQELGVTGRWLARAHNVLGGVLREVFDLTEARRYNEEGLELAAAAGFAVASTQGGIDLAYCDLLSGDVGGAEKRIPALGEMADAAKGFHQWLVSGRLAELVAEVALARGDAEEAADAAVRSMAEARRAGRVKYEVAARGVLARALLSLSKAEAAAEEARGALGSAEQLGYPPSIWSAAAVLSGCLVATGDDDGAKAAAGRALEALDSFAGALSALRRELFLAHPGAGEVLALAR